MAMTLPSSGNELMKRKTKRRLVAAMAVAIGALVLLGNVGNAQQPATLASKPVVDGAANADVTTHVITENGRSHQLVVVDTKAKAIAVYQIDPRTGEITLASVRNITWDLQMEELNSKRFLPPRDIREGLRAAE